MTAEYLTDEDRSKIEDENEAAMAEQVAPEESKPLGGVYSIFFQGNVNKIPPVQIHPEGNSSLVCEFSEGKSATLPPCVALADRSQVVGLSFTQNKKELFRIKKWPTEGGSCVVPVDDPNEVVKVEVVKNAGLVDKDYFAVTFEVK